MRGEGPAEGAAVRTPVGRSTAAAWVRTPASATAPPSRCPRPPPVAPTFFMRVAISLLRLLLYMRDFSAVRCLFREFCLASTRKAAAATLRTGLTAAGRGPGEVNA